MSAPKKTDPLSKGSTPNTLVLSKRAIPSLADEQESLPDYEDVVAAERKYPSTPNNNRSEDVSEDDDQWATPRNDITQQGPVVALRASDLPTFEDDDALVHFLEEMDNQDSLTRIL